VHHQAALALPHAFAVERTMNVPGWARTTHTTRRPERTWEAVIIGAGPAGGLAAYLLALRGMRVLLVEKADFPRDKVCGGCLNRRALDILSRVGLSRLCDRVEAPIIRRLQLCSGGACAEVNLPPSRAVSRRVLDAALVQHAVDAGADFWPNTIASVRAMGTACDAAPWRSISVRTAREAARFIHAKVVLVADGLGHPSLQGLDDFQTVVRSRSLVGLGTQRGLASWAVPPATIRMAVGKHGYVGAVQCEGDQVNVAAAVDVQALQRRGPAETTGSILQEAGCSVAGIAAAQWRGTRPLACTARRVAGERLFVLGDATGYVEPFTGEGMAWALASAVDVVALAEQACSAWDPRLAETWEARHASTQRREQRVCRAVSRFLRHPAMVRSAIGVLRCWPGLAAPLVHRVNFRGRQTEVVR
jgi:menaquinone-9 beta-reductase